MLTCEQFEGRTKNNLVRGYKIGIENLPGLEYVCLEFKNDGYISCYEIRELGEKKYFMGTRDENEADGELKKVTRRRLKELSEKLELEIAENDLDN